MSPPKRNKCLAVPTASVTEDGQSLVSSPATSSKFSGQDINLYMYSAENKQVTGLRKFSVKQTKSPIRVNDFAAIPEKSMTIEDSSIVGLEVSKAEALQETQLEGQKEKIDEKSVAVDQIKQ